MQTAIGRLVRQIIQGRLNNSEIARQTGLSRNTVASWRKTIAANAFTQDDFEGLSDVEIKKLTTPGSFMSRQVFYQPDFEKVRFEHQDRGIQLKLLHKEYMEKVPHGQNGMSLTTFYRTYKEHVEFSDPELHFVYESGEMIQFDFAGDKIRKKPTLLDESGRSQKYEIAVGTSALSQKSFIKAIGSQAKAPFLAFVSDMFEFFGGVPVLLTLDNFKAAIKEPRSGKDDAVPTAQLQEIADHYNFGIVAARVRKPRDKGAVENTVKLGQNLILAPLRNRTFHSLDELNAAIKPLLDALNDQPMKGHRNQTRNDRFERLDKQGYQPLPPNRYEYGDWILKVRAGKDYRVPVENNNRYSVPSRLAGQLVDVKVTLETIHIFHSGRSVATHKRADGTDQLITTTAHMPAKHRDAILTRLSGVKAAVREIGTHAVELIECHFRRHKKPSETATAAITLVSLAERFSSERVDAACAKAVRLGAANPTKVENILLSGLETFEPEAEDATDDVAPSGNVRGSEYFANVLDFNTRKKKNG